MKLCPGCNEPITVAKMGRPRLLCHRCRHERRLVQWRTKKQRQSQKTDMTPAVIDELFERAKAEQKRTRWNTV
jgi:hypothetical protein